MATPLSPCLLGYFLLFLLTTLFLGSASTLQTWRIGWHSPSKSCGLPKISRLRRPDLRPHRTVSRPAITHLADQLNRASLSISSNIAEGNGRFTKPDRKTFLCIARGSVQECVPQLELARRRKLVSDEHHSKLKQQLEEISRMLSGLINGLDNRAN